MFAACLPCAKQYSLYNLRMDGQSVETTYITPISESQQAEVVQTTQGCIERAEQLYHRDFATVPVVFDLRGKCAGMYQSNRRGRQIRYNPWLFAKYYQHSLEQTVPHEVAHYITDCVWGIKSVKPHGKEWKSVVTALGGKPVATGNYSLQGIPTKQYQRFAYYCDCKTHQLTTIRHRRVLAGEASYHCRLCGQSLIRSAQ